MIFSIFFNFLTDTFYADDTDNVSSNLFVSHYECSKMQDNRIYSLKQLADGKIARENLYLSPSTITL